MSPNNIVSFNCIDVSQASDAMLVGKDAVIATLVVATPNGNYTAQLETAGEINVEYDGVNYRDPAEFPAELRSLISSSRGACLHDGSVDGLMCWANNWFQIAIFDPNSNFISNDPPILESGLDMLGPEGVREELLAALEEYLK